MLRVLGAAKSLLVTRLSSLRSLLSRVRNATSLDLEEETTKRKVVDVKKFEVLLLIF